MAPTDGAAGHAGEDPQGGRVAGVLLVLPRLQPGCGAGIRGVQVSRVLWEREGRMECPRLQCLWPHCPALA